MSILANLFASRKLALGGSLQLVPRMSALGKVDCTYKATVNTS